LTSVSLIQNQTRCLNYQPIQSKNIVKIGHKMTQALEKKRIEYVKQQADSAVNTKYNSIVDKKAQKLLISCSNPQFNHYTNQSYKDQGHDKYLFSSTWFNRRSAGKYFTINSYGKHPSQPDKNQPFQFEHMNLNQILVELLRVNLRINQPTNIQQLSVNEIMNHLNHILVVAETSGGKTLAYLLPIIESVVKLNMQLEDMKINRNLNEPIGIICVPTRELVFQIYDVLKKFLNFEGMEEILNNSDDKYSNCLKNFNIVIDLKESQLMAREKVRQVKFNKLNDSQKPIDLLITIPSQLESRLNAENPMIKSTYLRKLVFDEADTLLDDSFNYSTLNCIQQLNLNLNLPKNESQNLKDLATQLIFVSATTPNDLRKYLHDLINPEMSDEITSIRQLKTPQSTRLMLHVPQKFIRSNGERRRADFLQTIQRDVQLNRTVLIFSNRTNTSIYVNKFLNENKIECELITKQLTNEERERIMGKFATGNLKCLSATDIASRGWDTLQVNHVINFEMPLYVADYVHRIGRVGRLNSKTKNFFVTNYVTKPYELDLVMNLERSIRFENELKNLDGNIKKLITDSYMAKK
jgi:superfamily II DNA/RNA helicase